MAAQGRNQRAAYNGNRRVSAPAGSRRGGATVRKGQRRRTRKVSPMSIFLFSGVMLYQELLLRIFNSVDRFWSWGLLRIALFSAAAGSLVYLLLSLIRNRRARNIVMGVLVGIGTVLVCVEYCCKSFFKTYFGLGYMLSMSKNVATDFAGTTLEVIFTSIPFFILALLPAAAILVFKDRVLPAFRPNRRLSIMMLVMALVCHGLGVLISFGNPIYAYEFTTDAAIPEFGLQTAMRLEIKYALTGMPEEDISSDDLLGDAEPVSADVQEQPEDASAENTVPETTAEPVVYDDNALEYDFVSMAAAETDKNIASIHKYLAKIEPSAQNEYTGYFKDKNLILITAEAFSPYVISKELTPTLYRLANEGFVFENYYQPDWSQSTTGGEFAVLTGLVPSWVNGDTTFVSSAQNNMEAAPGWLFKEAGYDTLAFHNNTYTYYDRDKTHPNLGYAFYGLGNGLKLQSSSWPNSDHEMMQSTVDYYIRNYVENGTKFHTYYITVSGHANYSWTGNSMSKKHRATVEAAYPNYSSQIQAYIACNLEVEYALQHLVQKLEEAGIADDTVIVLTADHYPYGLAKDGNDFYPELSGINDSDGDITRYKNSLIMWSGSMQEPIMVDTPCSSIDIVPTLYNLFGIEYDSRLYAGRDIFAGNYDVQTASTCMPLVVFHGSSGGRRSWITAAGTYDADTKTFTPNPGVVVADNYVNTVINYVDAKCKYSKLVVQYDYYKAIFGDAQQPFADIQN